MGREESIGELANLIVELIGKSVQVEIEEARLRPGKSEVQRLLSDNHKARERLGWYPQVELREGLELTIAWIRNNLQHYRPGEYQV